MTSFNPINYSLRPSKIIQRTLAFEGLARLKTSLELEDILYVGFGSVWFADFHVAHKSLGIQDMISIEEDPITVRRAIFNQPFKTVTVIEGRSSLVLPKLYANRTYHKRPWLVWLDYTKALDEETVEEFRLAVEKLPQNSVLLATFNALASNYGQAPVDRPGRVKTLLGSVVPDDLSPEQCSSRLISETLADLSLKFLMSEAADIRRPGGFLPAFKLPYADNAAMVTIGGIFPAKGAVVAAESVIEDRDWPGIASGQISVPHLTLKEVAVLQSQLPTSTPLDRATVKNLGFDLKDEELRAFERYYKQYPSFVRVAT